MSYLTFKIIYLVISVIILILILSNRGNDNAYKIDTSLSDIKDNSERNNSSTQTSEKSNVEHIKKSITIGRHPENDIVVHDPLVSRRCIQITQYEDGRLVLLDLQSRCCRVNGHLVEGEEMIGFGDVITIGNNTFVPWEESFLTNKTDKSDQFLNWERWKTEHPNVIAIDDPLGWGHCTHHAFMLATVKVDYPDWRVIRINDNKFLYSMGYDGEYEYAVYESSLELINRKGDQKTITFHTFGKVLVIH